MTAVYLIRHPQTSWNAASRYQGRLEAPLSEQGKRQATLLAAALADHPFDLIMSSPLSRARLLAEEMVSYSGSPMVLDARLTEIGLGDWEGLYRDEIEAAFPESFGDWYTRPATATIPGGETLDMVGSRALSVLSEVFLECSGSHVALVTHSAVIQAVVCRVLGIPLDGIHEIRVSNAGITTLCGDAAPGALLTLNALDQLYGAPTRSADAQDCVSWRRRRTTL